MKYQLIYTSEPVGPRGPVLGRTVLWENADVGTSRPLAKFKSATTVVAWLGGGYGYGYDYGRLEGEDGEKGEGKREKM